MRKWNITFLTVMIAIELGFWAHADNDAFGEQCFGMLDARISASLLDGLRPIEQAINALPYVDQSTAALRRMFIQELYEIACYNNPPVTADISYILVLSGRSSYLKKPIDRPDIPDEEDDYNRMRLGIHVARTVTALRLDKPEGAVTHDDITTHGPTIIYNGRPQHNADLIQALQEEQITDYPPSKFLILDLPADQLNSKGHFMSVQQKLDFSYQSVAIVTSAFHFPRIGRMLAEKAPFNYLGRNVTIHAYLYDRTFQAPGSFQDLVEEVQKIPVYIEKGDLRRHLNTAILFRGNPIH